ncbi:uncharacterized protein LOC131004775 [Salvia miltiorrhiza]|uniref:uncharacterized protein LOC131004775 n=1 Tax=Salvia miltiorrhiza TaxID=226208 RepID=UPI0025AC57B0|nr:uncharacterized protein LOC131004775 [Salvia miltiorrhiza]
MVLKDAQGSVLGCRFGFQPGVFTAVEGEAMATLEGIVLCREIEVQDIIFETDCQELYWLLVKRETDLSYLGVTVEKIYREVVSFRHIAFSWTEREGNSIADGLARFALQNFSPLSSSRVLPSFVNSGVHD